MGYVDARGFTFDGISSERFGLRIVWFGAPDAEVPTGLSVDVQKGDFNMVRHVPNQYGVKYQETLTIELGVMKVCPFGNLSYEESRAINKWLMGATTYRKLLFHDKSPETVHYYAVCTEIKDMVYNGLAGKKLKFVCNAPYGFLAERKYELDMPTEKGYGIRLMNQSDDGDYYPLVRYIPASGYTETFEVSNSVNGTGVVVLAMPDVPMLSFDMGKSRVTDDSGRLVSGHRLGWSPNDIDWLRLVPGWNDIYVYGKGRVEFVCEFPRKVGIV